MSIRAKKGMESAGARAEAPSPAKEKGGRATCRPRHTGKPAAIMKAKHVPEAQKSQGAARRSKECACRALARLLVAEQYGTLDEIWKRRVRYASVSRDYDRVTVKEINRRMPNLLVKQGGVPLDELADEYGFASTCDLVERFANYINKSVALERFYRQAMAEYEDGAADVPF